MLVCGMCVCCTVYLCVCVCGLCVYVVCVVSTCVYVCVCECFRNNTGMIFSLITISISVEMYMYIVNYSELLLPQHVTLQMWFRSEAVWLWNCKEVGAHSH